MPIVVPGQFPLSPALGAGYIRALEPIANSAGEFLLAAAHYAYATCGAANLLTHVNAHGLLAISGITYTERLRCPAQLGETRRYIAVSLEGENLRARVRLLDTGGASLDSAEALFSLGTRGHQTVVLDAGAPGIAVQLAVDLGQNSLSGDGVLYGVQALEVPLTGAELPLDSEAGFQRCSDKLVMRGRVVGTRLLHRLMNSSRAAQQTRLRSGRVVFDQRNPPRFCGLVRIVYPMLWPLTPRAQGLRVKISHKVGNAPVRYGLILRHSQDLRRAPLETLRGVVDVATTGGSVVDTELVLEPTAEDPEPLAGYEGLVAVLVCLECEADWDSEVLLEGPTTAHGNGWLDNWRDGWLTFEEMPSGSPAPFVAGEVPQAAVRFGVERYKIAGDPGSGTEQVDAEDYLGAVPIPPQPSQVVKVVEDTALRVWPRTGTESAYNSAVGAGGGAWHTVYWAPLGYSEVQSIEIRNTLERPLADYGTRLNAGQDPVAASIRQIYRPAYDVYQEHGRVLAVGPCSDPWDDTPPETRAAVSWWGSDPVLYPANHAVSSSLRFGENIYVAGSLPGAADSKPGGGVATWGELAWAAYGQVMKYRDLSRIDHFRRHIKAAALVRLVDNVGAVGKTVEARFRLVAEDAGSLADRVEGELRTARLAIADYLRIEQHALRGVIPATGWQEAGVQLVELSLEDTGVEASSNRRIILEAQATDRPVGVVGSNAGSARQIEVLAWCCWLAPVPFD